MDAWWLINHSPTHLVSGQDDLVVKASGLYPKDPGYESQSSQLFQNLYKNYFELVWDRRFVSGINYCIALYSFVANRMIECETK